MGQHVVVWNVLFGTVQLLIAVGLFWSRTVKLALAASIGWAVVVWWLGEGLGGVLGGPVSPLMGLPGAVFLYALIAVLLWPPHTTLGRRSGDDDAGPVGSLAAASPLRGSGARLVWLALWAGFTVEALRPADRAPGGLHDLITGMADGEPGWIKTLDTAAASTIGSHGPPVSVGLATLCVLIGASVLTRSSALARAGLGVAIILGLAIWVVGEDFGQIATRTATDPNSGPLRALLALCYWPFARHHTGPAGAAMDEGPGRRPADRWLTVAALAGVTIIAAAALTADTGAMAGPDTVGVSSMSMPLLPGWLTVVWVVSLCAVWLLHLWHAWSMPGPTRWWHGGHMAMAAGMIVMYLVPEAGHARLYWGGVGVFAPLSLGAGSFVAATWRRHGRPSWLWAASTVDMMAMLYMSLPATHRSAIATYLFLAYLCVEVLLWSLAPLGRAVPAEPGRVAAAAGRAGDALPQEGAADGGAGPGTLLKTAAGPHTGHHPTGRLGAAALTLGVRMTLAVMSASMAWMLIAMQTMHMAMPMMPTMPMR